MVRPTQLIGLYRRWRTKNTCERAAKLLLYTTAATAVTAPQQPFTAGSSSNRADKSVLQRQRAGRPGSIDHVGADWRWSPACTATARCYFTRHQQQRGEGERGYLGRCDHWNIMAIRPRCMGRHGRTRQTREGEVLCNRSLISDFSLFDPCSCLHVVKQAARYPYHTPCCPDHRTARLQ